MKVTAKITRVLLISVFLIIFSVQAGAEEKTDVKELLAEAYVIDGDHEKAKEIYGDILKEDPHNVKARLQKARILGWQRRYAESIEEYEMILKEDHDEKIELEIKAKKAYWDNRVRQAISHYRALVEKDPENVEAMFDLSQVYSYQGMWEDAIGQYESILEVSPTHFRAKEALEKVNLIASRVKVTPGYEFFEADSSSRSEDIKRHSFFSRLRVPFNYKLNIDAGYRLTGRSFSDFGDVLENRANLGFTYLRMPDWRLEAHYSLIDYNKDIDTLHLFGGQAFYRISDIVTSVSSFDRKQLENTSRLIRDGYYSDDYKQRFKVDVNKRLKIGVDYLFSYYSDDNYKHEPGFDVLYFVMLDPTRLAVKYRYFYREFDEKVPEYFSPKGFCSNAVEFNWRHFLNKEEIFFGADDLYYDLKYELAVDSKNIVSHKFGIELNWDINKRLNFRIGASMTDSSADIYDDSSVTASIRYYF